MQTVKMKFDMGDHLLIKLRPYWTLIHKIMFLEETVKDMLEAGMIK